jgi:hypothetical protein
MPARLDIALQRNEDWARTLTITDNAGAPIDLSGCTLAMQVRDKLRQTLIAEAEVTIVDPAGGIASVVLRASEGTPLSNYGATIQIANLHHDLRMTDRDGVNTALLAGLIILSRGETVS